MTWEIFIGITTLVSFIIGITGPLLKLSTSITKLNDSIEMLKQSISNVEDTSNRERQRIWSHNDEQDKILDEHERRLTTVETVVSYQHPGQQLPRD